jgi:TetR/AcrR family transcriptional regulator, tetracycline repressor protein
MVNKAAVRVNRRKPAAKRKPGRPRKGESGIDLERIVQEAWVLVDRSGMAALSTRTLAAALNVKSPALYWHVRGKDELLSLMMEHLLQHSLNDAPTDVSWAEWLKYVARRQRQLLLAHRDSGLIASLASPTERLRTEVFPRMMEPLLAAGFPPQHASAAIGTVAALVLGWVIYEQRPETREFVEAFHNSDEGFEFAIGRFVEGMLAAARSDR